MMNNTNNKPLFFLFTCIKDGNQYVDKLFNSLLNQTKINFVHFIYEDGSNVPLGNKIIEYKDKVSKLDNPYEVIYEYNPVNIGLNKSTQYCISKCSCPYFIWIDCDNYVDIHFFDELEKLQKRNKKAILLRTICHDTKYKKEIFFNCGTIKESLSKYQLGLLIRAKYYYSLFAVNFEKYKNINPNNIMDHNRNFYNDEQVLLLCLLGNGKTALSKNAIGYFMVREGQESSQYNVPLNELREYQIHLASLVNNGLGLKLTMMYLIKDLYEELFKIYQTDFTKSRDSIKQIRSISRREKISLKNYYDYSLVKQSLRVYYWRFKKIWKKS